LHSLYQLAEIAAMNFEIIGQIEQIEVIARGSGIRELPRLRRVYGREVGVN